DDTGGGSSSTSGGGGTTEPTCTGVLEDGVCVAACDPATCAPGNSCIGNRCPLVCEGQADCFPGQACTDAQDDTGLALRACLPSSKAAILGEIATSATSARAGRCAPTAPRVGRACVAAPLVPKGFAPTARRAPRRLVTQRPAVRR